MDPSQMEKYRRSIHPAKDREGVNNFLFYKHHVYKHIFNGNLGAPVHEKLQNGAKVLEFGCETAVWTIEVAADYPDSEFYAIDFTIFSSASDSDYDNVTFIECDIFKKLPFPDNEFDYVFSRDKMNIFGKDHFHDVLSELLRVLKPGGWLEVGYSHLKDINITPPLGRLFVGFFSWLKLHNIDSSLTMNFEKHLEETGKFEVISQHVARITCRSDYAFGEFARENTITYFHLIKDVIAPLMKMSNEEFDNLINEIDNDMKKEDGLVLQQKRVFANKTDIHSETKRPF